MPSVNDYQILSPIVDTLRFEYAMGDVTTIRGPQSTGWRSLPWIVVSQAIGYSGKITYKDGRTSHYGDGEACCIMPGITHNIDITPTDVGVARWCHVNFFVLGSVNLFAFESVGDVLRGRAAQNVGDLCEALNSLHSRPAAGLEDLLRRKSAGLELAAAIAAETTLGPQASSLMNNGERFSVVLQYMADHLSEPMTRDSLASLVSLSSSRFYAAFRSAFGIGPWDYLRDLRMRKAEQLLITTDDAVGEIGAQCGFGDPFHFSRLFRSTHGISPSAYRARVRESLA